MTDVDITPEDMQRAGARFAEGQGRICFAWQALSLQLSACAGMAGHPPDKAAVAFAEQYHKAVTAAWHALSACVTSIGGMAECFGATAGFYLNADHHSTVAVRGSRPGRSIPVGPPPPLLAPTSTTVVIGKSEPVPPSALGPAGGGPATLPTGDTGKLHSAASSWAQARAALSEVAGQLGAAITPITETGTSDAEAIARVWSMVYMPCNVGTVLAALIELCAGISHACTHYAEAVAHARHQAMARLAAAGVPLLLLDGGGLFLSPETAGASDVAAGELDYLLISSILRQVTAGLLTIVGALAVGALGDHLIQATRDSANRAPRMEQP